MKIVDNRQNENTKYFEQLNIGDTFCTTKFDGVFMRVESVSNYYDDGFFVDHETIMNAICLNNGNIKLFYGNDKVIPLNCKCIIADE